jgi:hypothetical protein
LCSLFCAGMKGERQLLIFLIQSSAANISRASDSLDPSTGMSAEIVLNIVWAATAVAAYLAWVRWRTRPCRRLVQHLTALLLASAVLFPVVSMTDDVWAAQNPAEPDTCQRRHNVSAVTHGQVPCAIVLAGDPPVIAQVADRQFAISASPQSLSPNVFVDGVVFTRPPPTA